MAFRPCQLRLPFKPPPNFTNFLDLPYKIKEPIYIHFFKLFETNHRIFIHKDGGPLRIIQIPLDIELDTPPTDDEPRGPLALLLSNKQIYHEAIQVLFTKFRFEVGDQEPEATVLYRQILAVFERQVALHNLSQAAKGTPRPPLEVYTHVVHSRDGRGPNPTWWWFLLATERYGEDYGERAFARSRDLA